MVGLKRVTLRTRPYLFDHIIQDIQQSLALNLPWLDYSFGRSERLVKEVKGVKYYTPNLYIGKGEYIELTPNQGFGNFSFFTLDEPEEITWEAGITASHRCPYSLVVWLDLSSIDYADERNTEMIKDNIVKAARACSWIKQGGFNIERIYSHAESVYRGYTLDEVDNQFMMAPFCGWRFTGWMWIQEECTFKTNYLVVEPTDVQWITDIIDYDVYSDGYWKIQ